MLLALVYFVIVYRMFRGKVTLTEAATDISSSLPVETSALPRNS